MVDGRPRYRLRVVVLTAYRALPAFGYQVQHVAGHAKDRCCYSTDWYTDSGAAINAAAAIPLPTL